MLAGSAIRNALKAVMRRGAGSRIPDAEFNDLALRAFAHQFELNVPYRRYCERRGRTPGAVANWTEIPAVPAGAFKEVALVAGNALDAAVIFRTSGTTRGAEQRGVQYLLDPTLYEASLLPSFQRFVLRDRSGMRMLSLIPPHEDAADSSLGYMISTVMRGFGASGSAFFARTTGGLDIAGLNAALADLDEPVCLLGTSLAYLHWLDALGDQRLSLPAESRLMDTGGYKGETRAISSDELRARYGYRLGIAAGLCINEYGMTELCSQYYNAEDQIKRGPPWLRARVVNPHDLRPVEPGTPGILQHFDLANLDSVCAIQTEDMGVERADGFVLHGRAPGAAPRGCSIAMDILLSGGES
ncbi:MAG: LuxE/PaaK family acyltransferase [Gemmatimonadota bacterium]